MKRETLKLLDELFAEHPILRALEPATRDEVNAAASTLGIRFPESYREFVQRYGGAIVGAYPVYGLRPVELMQDDRWSVIAVTHYFRNEGIPEVSQWVVFSEDHAGNPVGFDSSGVVWTFDHDFGGLIELHADFEDYLRRDCLELET